MADKVLGDPVKGATGGVALLIGAMYLLAAVSIYALIYIVIFEIRVSRKILYVSIVCGSVFVPGFVLLSIAGNVIWGDGIAAVRSGDYWLVGAVITFAVSVWLGNYVLSHRGTVYQYLWGPPLFSQYPL